MSVCKHCQEDVELERDDAGDLICPECGWSQESAPKRRITLIKRSSKGKMGWVWLTTVLFLGQGIVSIPNLYVYQGLVDIGLAIGLFRLKETARDIAVILSTVQVVLTVIYLGYVAIGGPVGAGFFLFMRKFVEVMPVLIPLKLAAVVILTRKTVRVAFE